MLTHFPRQQVPKQKTLFKWIKSVVSVLYHLVHRIENILRYKDVVKSAFIDVEGAFDNTVFDSIKTAAESRHIEPETVEWITRMLECRIVRSRGCFIASAVFTCYR
jgi:hypothetical protein